MEDIEIKNLLIEIVKEKGIVDIIYEYKKQLENRVICIDCNFSYLKANICEICSHEGHNCCFMCCRFYGY